VLNETESLRDITGGRQEQVLHQNHKKQGSSGPDQGSSSKRLKTSQLEVSPEPKASTFQVDIDLADPFPALVTQSSNFVERTRHTMEQRWGACQDNGYNIYDGEGDNVDDENDATNSDDGDEDNDNDNEDEDNNNNKDEDNDKDNEDEDSGDNSEDESDNEDNECNHPGFSLWDKLGEDYEREAASLSLSSFL